ncbi:hypothetical protein [Dethiothermospora halolimnae]|uniref:hypothetical protein n=1 Tax=Dethiothermospora halolimnae TaxID=3114390 RepID=UPI003CCBC63E
MTWQKIFLIFISLTIIKPPITENNARYNIQKPDMEPIATISKENISLYPIKSSDEGGVYKELLLNIKGNSKKFSWKSVSYSSAFYPELIYKDINNDDQKELIIILTEATGTGVYIQKIHIINPNTFEEIKIESPLDIYEENVKTKVYLDKIEIEVNNKNYIVSKNQTDMDPKNWADSVMYKTRITFGVEGEELVSTIGLNIGFLVGYFGEIKIVYGFEDDKCIVKDIEFRYFD